MGRRGDGSGAGKPLRTRRGCDQARIQRSRCLRPQGFRAADANSGTAGHRGRAPAPGAKGLADQHGAGRRNGLGSRSASVRAPRRIRRRGDPSLPRAGVDHPIARIRAASLARGIGEALHQGNLQRVVQGHCQDGHLDLPVVLRCADLRGGRVELGVRPEIFHRNGQQYRGHRSVRSGRGSLPPASARVRRQPGPAQCARRGRRVHVPHPRRGAHVDAGLDRQGPARGTLEQPRDLPRVREAGQRAGQAADDTAGAVRVQVRRGTRVARRGGARLRNRQALCDRSHESGVDLDRSAYDAGSSDEPHRRQVEYRRRRRGREALPPDQERRDPEIAARRGGCRRRAQGRRFTALEDQAGRLGPLRRHRGISGQR